MEKRGEERRCTTIDRSEVARLDSPFRGYFPLPHNSGTSRGPEIKGSCHPLPLLALVAQHHDHKKSRT